MSISSVVVSQREKFKCILEYPYSCQADKYWGFMGWRLKTFTFLWRLQNGSCRILSLTVTWGAKKLNNGRPGGGWTTIVECIQNIDGANTLKCTLCTALWHLILGLWQTILSTTDPCKYLIDLALQWLQFKSQGLHTTWMSSDHHHSKLLTRHFVGIREAQYDSSQIKSDYMPASSFSLLQRK